MDADASDLFAVPWSGRSGRGPRPAGRFALILGLSLLFGAAMAWLKGDGPGLRDAIGNASAPWLLVPFLAGAAAGTATGSRRLAAGAAAGLAATLAALAGFYVTNSVVLELGPHPWLTDLGLTVRGGLYWFERALVSAPVFGALGGWWRRDRSLSAAAAIATMFVLEPAAWWLYSLRLGGGAAYAVPQYPALWLGEIAVGLAGFALLRAAARRHPAAGTARAGGPGPRLSA
ncbi:MAG: DUF6518 family protein [Streptosporangiaceae bacterium]